MARRFFMSTAWSLVERSARRALSLFALTIVFVLSAGVGLVVHLDTKPGRAVVARLVSSLASKELVGDIQVDRIDRLSRNRLVVSRATVLDRLGKPVLAAEGLDARFELFALLRGILGGTGVLVAIPDVHAERVHVWLTPDQQKGGITFETVFDMAHPGPPNGPKKPLRVALPRIFVESASVTTNQEGFEQTAGNVGSLLAALDFSPAGLVLSLDSDHLQVAGLFARDLVGKLQGVLRLPGTTKAKLDVHLGTAPLDLAVEWRRMHLDVDVAGKALDLASLGPGAPETALDLNGKAAVDYEKDLRADATVMITQGSVSGYPVPPVTIRGNYADGTLTGRATVLDPKLATNLEIGISPNRTITFAGSSADVDLTALGRYGLEASGRLSFHSRGVIEAGRLDATFETSVRSAALGPARAGHVHAHGRIHGPMTNPSELSLDVLTEGEELEIAGVRLERLRAHATRNPRGFAVSELLLHAGGGSLSGSIADADGRRSVDLTAHGLDLARLLAATRNSPAGIAGRIDGRARLEEFEGTRSGHVALDLRGGSFFALQSITGDLAVKFDRSEIETDAHFHVAGLANTELRARGSVRGSLFDVHALSAMTGEATVDIADVDLEQVSRRWLPDSGMEVEGRARSTVHVSRPEPSGMPAVEVRLDTEGLEIRKAGDSEPPATRILVDVHATGDMTRTEGGRLSIDLVDGAGTWITAGVEHSIGTEALARAGASGQLRTLWTAPLHAHVTANPRPLKMFGDGDGAALDGAVSGMVDVVGSAQRPEIDASGTLTGWTATGEERDESRLDVFLRYSAERERYSLAARTVADADRIELDSVGRFGWIDHGLGRDWSAHGVAKVSRLGLDRVGRLVGVPVAGEISGGCSFDVGPASLDVASEITLGHVGVGRHVIGSGAGQLEISHNRAQAMLSTAEGRSSLELLADARLVSTKDGSRLDPTRGGMLRATVRDFDVASVAPLLRSVATRVGGMLNGRAELSWGATRPSDKPTTSLRANATLAHGSINPVVGGGLIQDIDVRALAEGDEPLRLSFSGAARSHEPNLKGTALLRFDGPHLQRLDAGVEVSAFPLLYDGVLVGRATTGPRTPIEASIADTDGGQAIDIRIPAVEVELPSLTNKSLIALDADKSIDVTDAEVDHAEAQPKTGGGTGTRIAVELGKRVLVKRGALDVPLGGSLEVAPDGRLTGSITIRQGGVVPALGQLFRIRRGEVRFEGQAADEGTLAIQAWTRVADGTVIDLDVSGTVHDPVVRFHSDPPRSEEEIVALLLGIQNETVYNVSRSEGQQMGRTAMALAMNRLLRDSALSGLQFGAGETGEGEAVSTVSMRVGSKVWLEGRSIRGSETSVNQTERVSGVVDWRFAPTWSLRSQLGGVSGVELRWSLRY